MVEDSNGGEDVGRKKKSTQCLAILREIIIIIIIIIIPIHWINWVQIWKYKLLLLCSHSVFNHIKNFFFFNLVIKWDKLPLQIILSHVRKKKED